MVSEQHNPYSQHSDEEEDQPSPYDPNNVWGLEVNIRAKVKTLKQLILEKINLKKDAKIILLKQLPKEMHG